MKYRYYTDANPKRCVLQVDEPCEECGRYEKEGDGVNREEIQVMEPGLEMDIAVARKVFGYKVFPDPSTRVITVQTGRKNLWGVPVWDDLPSYSTRIEYAWQIVEHMRAGPGMRGCKACIELHSTDDEEEPYWAHIHGHEASGKTAPEAICKAALLAVMGRDA